MPLLPYKARKKGKLTNVLKFIRKFSVGGEGTICYTAVKDASFRRIGWKLRALLLLT